MMQRFLSHLFALVLVVAIGLVGCSAATNLSGDYRQDTLAVINSLRTAIELPDGSPDKTSAQAAARTTINEFFSQYRRNDSVEGLSSFTTMRTALNSLAGHYNSYPNRPLPEKLKSRLSQEFNQVEAALNRES